MTALVPRRFYMNALFGALALLAVFAACERQPEPLPVDTVVLVPEEMEDTVETAAPVPTTWAEVVGPALFIAGQTPSRALVVLPEVTDLRQEEPRDVARVRGATLDLFDRTGLAGQARVTSVADEPGLLDCPTWPQGALVPTGQSTALPSWSVAFVSGAVRPLALQPIDALARADSARLAAEAARLAAALPMDTASPFHGIPFYVRMAYRFSPAPDVEAIVAEVVRRVPLEAAPLEEHIIILGERSTARPDMRYRTAYHDRVSGVETAVSTWEVLAAVTLGEGGPPALILDSVMFEGDVYMLLQRRPDGRWRVRWSSAYAGC